MELSSNSLYGNSDNQIIFKNNSDLLRVNTFVLPKNEYYKVKQPEFEYQYKNSLSRILLEGIEVENRTGINTISVQHQHFILENVVNNFPRIRGKKVFPRMALTELCWMLLGRTDIKWLQDHGVNYWNEWAREDGTIGRSYGKQFRDFNGIDQIDELIFGMINNPLSRRHIVNLWNANELFDMSLPPCFYDFHFGCIPDNENYLVDLHVRSRSEDSFIGQPYDFMFVSLFLIVITNFLNTKSDVKYIPRNVHYTADDYHLYINHKDALEQYKTNVTENKNSIIDTQTKVTIKESKIFDFDQYITTIAENKTLIVFDTKDVNFEYPQIKADVAI